MKILLACSAVILAACATPPRVAHEAPGAAPAGLEAAAALGVRVESVRLSSAGYMLDLRYRVLDVDKARPLFDRKVKPRLLDEAAGAQLAVPTVPKLGQLRTTSARNVKADRSYSMLFANPGRFVERGKKVSLVIGEARIDGLVVE
jgi:hypothetical protein